MGTELTLPIKRGEYGWCEPVAKVRKYRVHGIAFCPIQAEAIVEASSPDEAVTIAQARFSADKMKLIVSSRSDEPESAFDWLPTVEEME